MEFKRLNNMTGKDPLLNRRITSIFISELSNLIPHIGNSQKETIPALAFMIHQIIPSLVIFEMESLHKDYESLVDLVKNKADTHLIDEKKQMLLDNVEENLEKLNEFVNSLA
jgi:hypothetical protein